MQEIRRSHRYIGLVAVVMWLASCGGGGPSNPDAQPDVGPPDVTADADATNPDQTTTPDTMPDGVSTDAGDTVEVDGADATPTDQVLPPDATGDVTGPDCTQTSDCEGLLTLTACEEATCLGGVCVAEEMDNCCASVDDCTDDNDCTADLCPEPGQACVFEPIETCCSEQQVLLSHDFEDGDISGFEILDPNSGDSVTWQVDEKRSHSGQASLYLGDPTCHTYYNGGLGADCQPALGTGLPTQVNITLRTPSFQVPPDSLVAGSFWLRSDVEPMLNLEGVPESDNLVVRANGFATSVQVFDAVQIDKNTGGSFKHVVFDLTQFAGETVQLELSFNTYDGANNLFEGVYIDDLHVFSYCGAAICEADGDCDDDANACTDNVCSPFTNSGNASTGVCAYPVSDGDCSACSTDLDCASEDTCLTAFCQSNGVCSITAVESPECCVPETMVSEAFNSSLAGWDLGQNGQTGWHITNNRGSGDSTSLHFGKEDAPGFYSFDNGGLISAAQVSLPPVSVSNDNPILTFDLLLSTEWDGAPIFNPPFPIDQLTVHVSGSTGAVWNSDVIQGTTNQQFQPITVDLSDFSGDVVTVSLSFNSGDGDGNTDEGVFVDNLEITSSCNKPKCSVATDCNDDDACTVDQCNAGVCVFSAGEATCCSSNSECDDEDPCTFGECLNNACVFTPTNEPSCCLDVTWASYSFENGLGGFTVEQPDGSSFNPNTQWKVITAGVNASAGVKSAYFGDTANMTLGSVGVGQGSLHSPNIIVPETGSTMISFDVTLKTRWAQISEGETVPLGFSQFNEDNHADYLNSPAEDSVIPLSTGSQALKEQLLFVRVHPIGGGAPTNVWYSGYVYGFTDQAVPVTVDLTPWAGQYVSVEWFFSTYFDPILAYEGVYIDNISVSSVCQTNLECVGGQDCPFDGDTCTHNACENFQCTTVPGPGEGCCVPSTIWSTDFEVITLGAAGFTEIDDTPNDDVGWNLVGDEVTWPVGTNPKHSGTTSIYYGNLGVFPQNYESGSDSNSSSLMSGPIQLPAQGPFEINFWMMHDVEAFSVEFERFRIEVIPTGGEGQAAVLIDTYFFASSYINPLMDLNPDIWAEVSLGGFDSLAGEEVQIRIIFDTLDELDNDTIGLFIDDIGLNTSCP